MGFSATVLKEPRIFVNGVPTHETLQAGLRAGLGLWVATTQAAQSAQPTIAAAWGSVEDVADGVQARNPHPAMGPMNNGATWPGKMPNITAMGDYLERRGGTRRGAWIAARLLQLKGMPAQHWTSLAWQQIHAEVRALCTQPLQTLLRGTR